jgi:hypothetical protein
MKLLTPLSIGVLTLLLGAPAIVCAQDDAKPPKQEEPKPHPDQAKPARGDEDKPKDVKPEKRDDMKPENAKPEDMKRQDAKPEDMKREEGRQEEKRDDAKPQERNERDRNENEHAGARPTGKRVDRIPEDRFRQNFGREHVTIINRPVIVEGRPHFQFGGYWFGISDPWPVGWAYSDQVYVDYVDGEYFLFDVLHPGVRIALFVTE